MEPRILVLAEAANPQLTSAALVAWNHFSALREVCKAHLVTELRNRDAILEAGLPEDVFTTIDNRRPMHLAWQISNKLRGSSSIGWTTYTALCSLVYPRFEQKVWWQFGEQLQRGEFDIVHRIAPITPVAPSFIAKRCAAADVPFVMGPINGGVPWPKGFRHLRGREREWLGRLRWLHRWLPGYRSTRRHAAAIITASSTASEDLAESYQAKCVKMPENAVDLDRFSDSVDENSAPDPASVPVLKIAYWGRFVPLKGLRMLFEAAEPLMMEGKATIDLAGEGPEEPRLRQWVEQRGLSDQVHFHGQLDQSTLARRMASMDVLGFPSVREFGGGAVLEAMALGLMPIVVDHGGPPDLVPESIGRRIAVNNRRQMISDLRKVLEDCANDLAGTRARGRHAMQYVADRHTWEHRAKSDLEIYRWVLGQGKRPDWRFPLPPRRSYSASGAQKQDPASIGVSAV